MDLRERRPVLRSQITRYGNASTRGSSSARITSSNRGASLTSASEIDGARSLPRCNRRRQPRSHVPATSTVVTWGCKPNATVTPAPRASRPRAGVIADPRQSESPEKTRRRRGHFPTRRAFRQRKCWIAVLDTRSFLTIQRYVDCPLLGDRALGPRYVATRRPSAMKEAP